jgi:hypothetical protein
VERELGVLEAAEGPGAALQRHAVLREPGGGIQAWLEVGLADQGGAVPHVPQHGGHARGVVGEGDAVGVHAVGAGVLAGMHSVLLAHAWR